MLFNAGFIMSSIANVEEWYNKMQKRLSLTNLYRKQKKLANGVTEC